VKQHTGERGSDFLRRADRAVGIPAILAVGLLRRLRRVGPPSVPESPAVIGVLKASGIGDAVILSGVLADLREWFPSAKIVLFSGTSNYAFSRLLGDVDEVVPLPIRKPLEAVRIVRRYHPDVMIDCGMWPRFESIVSCLSGARFVVGVETPGQHRHFAYDRVIQHSSDHEIVNYRNLVAALGVVSSRMPVIRSGIDSARPMDSAYVVLHLWPGGSNAAERSWPEDRWLVVARALAARGDTIVLSGGPDDVERTRALSENWKSASLDVVSIAGLNAEQTIVWLRHARGVISVNTGLLHLAAAVDTPTIAINGPTSGKRWGPLGKYTRCVSSPMIPEGYLHLGWERDDRYATCMEAIAPESVLAAWDELAAEVHGVDRLATRET
jgi:ADP-heptose:LPS heptosyltransferase